MARELHDVIGHTVNLLVVQAGAARLMLDRDPSMTRDLLTGMEQTGREALADLDQALGTLRAQSPIPDAGPDAAEPLPSPGLAQLPDLVDRLGDSGVDVTLSLDSAIRLPRNLDLSAYRIVQEALTNALKHAAPCSATVDVRRDGRAVVVEVSDDGPGLPESHVPGRGLLGIAERVSLCGGVLEHGAGARGGFTLRAVLPLP
jgi:signal transduction histidine kinase